MRRGPGVLLLALLLAASAAGCRRGGAWYARNGGLPPIPKGAALAAVPLGYVDDRAPAEVPADGDRIVRTLEGDCSTLNPILSSTNFEQFVLGYMFRNVLEYDKDLDLVPGLAESWEMSPDHLSYTFHLQKDATWEDGVPVTADDFLFTMEKIVDPKVPTTRAGYFGDYAGAEVLGRHTIVIRFKQPYAGQASAFNMSILPRHVYGTGDFQSHPANRKPVGNGPYRFSRWETNKEIELVRREDYPGPKGGPKKILFRVIPDESVRLAAQKTGQVDEGRLSGIQWKEVKDDPAFSAANRILLFHQLAMPNFISWNNRSPFFSDKRVRQAMSQLIDRDAIVRNIYYGTAEPASQPFAFGTWARDQSLAPWPYAPPEARRKIAEAGWRDTDGDGILDKDGKPFRFEILIPAGSVISEQIATLLQRECDRLGIVAQLRQLEYGTLMQKTMGGEYEAVLQALTVDVDPDPIYILHTNMVPPGGFNFAFYSNPEADRLLDAGRLEFDRGRRAEIYHRLSAVFHEDEPMTMVVYPAMKWAVSKRLRGVSSSPLGLFLHHPGPLAWWVAPAGKG